MARHFPKRFGAAAVVGLAFASLGPSAGCVQSTEAPPLVPQAKIAYQSRIVLVDDTEGTSPTRGVCTRLGTVLTASTASVTVTPTDGRTTPIEIAVPHNCFAAVTPRSELSVDSVEVTNELYQLCVDSGACKTPDPSESSKTQLCSIEERFDQCPVVEIPQAEAATFCKWVGRRLPNSFESLAIRQANLTDPTNPETMTVFPTGNEAPEVCDDAVLDAVCQTAKPRPVISLGGDVSGGAPRDVVLGTDGVRVFDVMGNVAEWTSDLFQIARGNARGLPWFCIADLPAKLNGELDATNPPICPEGLRCIYGQYKPGDGLDLDVWPVCIAQLAGSTPSDAGNLFSGSIGAVFGGHYRDTAADRQSAGVYARQLEEEPQGLPSTERARTYGFRCVDERASADAAGNIPTFQNLMVLTRFQD